MAERRGFESRPGQNLLLFSFLDVFRLLTTEILRQTCPAHLRVVELMKPNYTLDYPTYRNPRCMNTRTLGLQLQ